MKKYGEKQLIILLKQLSREVGKTPTIRDLRKKKGYPSYIAYYYNFGCWNEALRKAELAVNFSYKLYSNKELLDFLKKFYKKHKRSPKTKDFDNNEKLPSSQNYFKHFGSWNNALRKAGLKTNVRKDYTKKELLELLKKKAEELGRSPIGEEINQDKSLPDRTTYDDHFGSLNNALKQAGLEVMFYNRKWTKLEIIIWLKKKRKELGKSPGMKDFDTDPKAPGKNTVGKLFGNWTNALREAKIPVNKFNTEKELIQIMQKLAKKLNRTPTRLDMNKTKGFPSYTPFVEKFGSYTAACLRAGLIPNNGRNNSIWKEWEKHCEKMSKVIYKNIEVKKRGLVEGIPDIYIPYKNMFIDAKTCGYRDFKDQINRYAKKQNLEFWLIFKGIETKRKNVKYVYAEELAEQMQSLGREDLAAKCHQFIRNIFDESQKTLEA